MDPFGPFGLTTVAEELDNPSSDTAVLLGKTSHWRDSNGDALTAPFNVMVRHPGIPDYGVAERVRVLSYNATGITSMTRAQGGTTAIDILPGDEVYPDLTKTLDDIAAQAESFYSGVVLGLVGDDATMNHAAMNAIAEDLAVGARVAIPPGVYRYDPAHLNAMAQSVHWDGHGYEGVVFKAMNTTDTTSSCISITGPNVTFAHITFTTNVARTSGSMVTISGAGAYLDDCLFNDYFCAVSVTDGSENHLYRCSGSSTVTNSIGVQFSGGNVHYMDHCSWGNDAVHGTSYGVQLIGAGTNTVTITNTFIASCAVGVYMACASGQDIGIFRFIGCDIDSNTQAVIISVSGSGVVGNIEFLSCWTGDTGVQVSGGHAITINDDGLGEGQISSVIFRDCISVGNASGKNCLHVASTLVHGLVVDGGDWGADSADCIATTVDTEDWSVSEIYALTTTSGYGVSIYNGAASRYNVLGNILAFCASGTSGNGHVHNPSGLGNVANNV